MELALEGSFTDDQRWLLSRELNQVEWLEAQVQVLEQEIERRVAPFEEPIGRLMTIPGIDRKTAWIIVAEIGVDMAVYGDAKRLASWAGREARFVSGCLGHVAYQEQLPVGIHKRIAFRRGAQRATMALAHHMIGVVYNVLARVESIWNWVRTSMTGRTSLSWYTRLVGCLARSGESPANISGFWPRHIGA